MESGSLWSLVVICAVLVSVAPALALTVPVMSMVTLAPGASDPTVHTPVAALKLPVPFDET